MSDTTVVIVPVYNEEEHLPRVLAPLHKWVNSGPNKKVVIVDDGNTDATRKVFAQFLKENNFPKNIQIIRSDPQTKINRGKGEAFIAGAMKARALGAKTLVTLDADLLDLNAKKIDGLVNELDKTKQNMLLAQISERALVHDIPEAIPAFLAGQRAIRMSALEPLFRGNRKWTSLIKGYGLEKALCHLIPKFEFSQHVTLVAERAYRKPQGLQDQEIEVARGKIKSRSEFATELAARLGLLPLIHRQQYTPPRNKGTDGRLREIADARARLNEARKLMPHLGDISKSRIRK